MDYYLDPTIQYNHEVTRDIGMNPVMRVLEEILDPNGTLVSAFRDCVLVSLDAEYNSEARKIDQIGLAILDTRELKDSEDEEAIKRAISSRLLLFKKQSVKKGKYLFGDPENCEGQSLNSLLLSVFTIVDSRTKRPRNIILVGHSIRNDVREIERSCGFSILALPMIKAVIDTSPLANRVFNASPRCHTLRKTCAILGMYRRNIHNGGNDAMYTLKALLLIYYHYKSEKERWDFSNVPEDRKLLQEHRLDIIKRIGRCNNGIHRFEEQREKSRLKAMHKQKADRPQRPNLLVGDENEDGIMDGLFTL